MIRVRWACLAGHYGEAELVEGVVGFVAPCPHEGCPMVVRSKVIRGRAKGEVTEE